MKKDIKKILVIRNDYIGDLVLSSSVFREIRKEYPKSKIVALVSNKNKEIIAKNKNIDEIIVSDPFWRKGSLTSFLNYLKVIRRIRKEKFEVGIDVKSSFLNIFFFLYLGNIKKRVAYYNHPMNKQKNFLTDYARYDSNVHASDSDLEIVNVALNMKSKNSFPDIATDKEDENNVKSFIKKNNVKKFICICPDASSEKKQWPLNRFDEIIKHLQKNYPKYKIILVGGDASKINFLAGKNKGVISLIKRNLREVYLLFKKSSLIIAPDGGPMHLAWAAKANLIAFVPSYLSLKHIGPLGKTSHVIYKEVSEINVEEVKKLISKTL